MKMSVTKKRITFICAFICFSIGVYGIIGMLESFKEKPTLQASATPITNKIVIIDAGHGKPDEGEILLNPM